MSLSFEKSSFCYLEQKHVTDPSEAQTACTTRQEQQYCSQEDIQSQEEDGDQVEKVIERSREVRHYRSRIRTVESITIIINKVDKVERTQKSLRRFKGMFPSFTI